MFKIISVSLLAMTLLSGAAQAVQCPTFPNPLTNGTTADANAVMSDFQYLQNCPALGTNPSFTGNIGIGTTSPQAALDDGGGLLIRGVQYSSSGSAVEVQNVGGGVGTISMIANGATRSFGEMRTYGSPITFWPGGYQALTIANGGNVGIGTTSPDSSLEIQSTSANSHLHIGSVAPSIHLMNATSNASSTATGLLSLSTANGQYGLYTGDVMLGAYGTSHGNIYINSNYSGGGITNVILQPTSGNVGIGTTAPAEALDAGSGVIRANAFRGRAGYGGATSNVFNINWTGSAAQLWIDTTNVGTISTVSDRRLKQQILTEPDTGLSRIMQLRPVTFHWRNVSIFRDDGIQHDGFIADELQTVIPSAVVNNKDQVDANGKPVYQSIVPSEIIPVLTKALQEQQAAIQNQLAAIQNQQTAMQAQQAEIDSLKSQIAALQAAR